MLACLAAQGLEVSSTMTSMRAAISGSGDLIADEVDDEDMLVGRSSLGAQEIDDDGVIGEESGIDDYGIDDTFEEDPSEEIEESSAMAAQREKLEMLKQQVAMRRTQAQELLEEA